jgi:hypothetical protein
VRAFVLVSDLASKEAVEVFLREEDALAALDAAVADVPQWVDVLHVEAVDLDETRPTPN